MHGGRVPPHTAPSSDTSALRTSEAAVDFVDIHVRGRVAGLRKAIAVSARGLLLEEVLPSRVNSVDVLLQRLRASTHMIIQSHGVGWKDAHGVVRSEAQLCNGFMVDAAELPQLRHLRFLMLAACYQGRHLADWRRVAPNATLVLADGSVHPDDFSMTIVDLLAEAKLDGHAPTGARVAELFASHRDGRWRVCEPGGSC